MRHGRRCATAVVLFAGALLSGCNGASHHSPEVVPALASTALASPSAVPSRAAGRSPGTALPSAAVTGGTTAAPPPYRPAPATADARAQVDLVYDTWMADLSGLLGALSQPWADAVREVATPTMTRVASSAAGALFKAHDHTVGRLVDSHRVVRFRGATATLTDCLDELHWYVVEDASGRPDPSASRSYFVGTADLVLTSGRWYVSSWNSHPQPCTP